MKTKMHFGANPNLFTRARYMRKHPTDAEALLWEHLRKNKYGMKFRRQHPLNSFVVDFYCHSARLVIEVDGGIHESPEQIILDQEKDEKLKGMGIHILRYSNEEVMMDLSRVLEEIFFTVRQIVLPPPH